MRGYGGIWGIWWDTCNEIQRDTAGYSWIWEMQWDTSGYSGILRDLAGSRGIQRDAAGYSWILKKYTLEHGGYRWCSGPLPTHAWQVAKTLD